MRTQASVQKHKLENKAVGKKLRVYCEGIAKVFIIICKNKKTDLGMLQLIWMFCHKLKKMGKKLRVHFQNSLSIFFTSW